MRSVVPPYKRIDEHFDILSQIGEGTYGKVYKAQYKKSGRIVALKMIRFETEAEGFPLTALREIRALIALTADAQIAHFVEVATSESSVYLVFEYYPWDLSALLSQMNVGSSGASSPIRQVAPKCDTALLKGILKQVLQVMKVLHAKNILHRDIKASNILLGTNGDVCLADFGLSRLLAGASTQCPFSTAMKGLLTSRVVTLWYRAPELLLGCSDYDGAVDMWSVGCLMGEMFARRAPFIGSDECSQLEAIFDALPYDKAAIDAWPLSSLFRWACADGHVDVTQTLAPFRESMSEAGWDLFLRLLSVDPRRRPKAHEALQHPFFTVEAPTAASTANLQNFIASLPHELHEFEVKSQRKKRPLLSQAQ